MNWKTIKIAALAIGGILLCWWVIYWIGLLDRLLSRGLESFLWQLTPFDLATVRFMIIATSTAVGFALGWFLSPQARELRSFILKGLAALACFVAFIDGGYLGWGLTWIMAWIGFFAALGYWLRKAIRALAKVPPTFGSNHWATPEEIAENDLFGKEGIRIGAVFNGHETEAISYSGDRHVLLIAPTRKGKGTTQIVTNLLSYTGSALVIDPKGENALITAAARHEMGQEIYVLDPWGLVIGSDESPARFNPLDWLEAGDVDITENAMLLADAMIVSEGQNDAFWVEEAKALLLGIILYVATAAEEAGQRTLARVRDLMLLDGEDLKTLFTRMLESPHHIVASTGARCLQKEEKLLANVIASAQAQTHFLDSARMRESLSASDFRFEDLKTKPMTIYLVIPADRLHAFGRWLRMIIQMAITVNARNIAVQPEKPVLFMLDEMPALGRLTMVEQAYGLMAGFGMQLYGVVQDLSQLKAVYGDGWETFIANSGLIQYMGSRDRTTAEYFSALCGETTVWNLSSAVATAIGVSQGKDGITRSESETITDTRAAAQRKLAYPDELMRMHPDRQLVFVDEMSPIIATKIRWFEDAELAAKGVNLHAN
jgi:type IV secretion system protein VirD4